MPRFVPGEAVWAVDPLSGAVGKFEVLDVLEDFDEEYTDWALLLAPPVAPPGERGRRFCVSERHAFHTKEEAEAAVRRQNRLASKKPRPAGHEFSMKDAMRDMFTISWEGFRDKYMGILFSNEEEFKAFVGRVRGALKAVFLECLSEARPIGGDAP